MFGRRKAAAKKRPADSGDHAQFWARTPGPLDAMTGQFPGPEPVQGKDKSEVYPDEIDPEWADPDTADDQHR